MSNLQGAFTSGSLHQLNCLVKEDELSQEAADLAVFKFNQSQIHPASSEMKILDPYSLNLVRVRQMR